mmetsp:Transcript_28395/g.60492  ORF Transcript_28395/g.60492 Transcript_28395/m.60492 type:complete len:206 (-) Transcript_28395:671-1288(-)
MSSLREEKDPPTPWQPGRHQRHRRIPILLRIRACLLDRPGGYRPQNSPGRRRRARCHQQCRASTKIEPDRHVPPEKPVRRLRPGPWNVGIGAFDRPGFRPGRRPQCRRPFVTRATPSIQFRLQSPELVVSDLQLRSMLLHWELPTQNRCRGKSAIRSALQCHRGSSRPSREGVQRRRGPCTSAAKCFCHPCRHHRCYCFEYFLKW